MSKKTHCLREHRLTKIEPSLLTLSPCPESVGPGPSPYQPDITQDSRPRGRLLRHPSQRTATSTEIFASGRGLMFLGHTPGPRPAPRRGRVGSDVLSGLQLPEQGVVWGTSSSLGSTDPWRPLLEPWGSGKVFPSGLRGLCNPMISPTSLVHFSLSEATADFIKG